jgi:hypothetical protein
MWTMPARAWDLIDLGIDLKLKGNDGAMGK